MSNLSDFVLYQGAVFADNNCNHSCVVLHGTYTYDSWCILKNNSVTFVAAVIMVRDNVFNRKLREFFSEHFENDKYIVKVLIKNGCAVTISHYEGDFLGLSYSKEFYKNVNGLEYKLLKDEKFDLDPSITLDDDDNAFYLNKNSFRIPKLDREVCGFTILDNKTKTMLMHALYYVM